MPVIPAFDPINFLVDRKFPRIGELRFRAFAESQDEVILRTELEPIENVAESYRQELEKRSAEEIRLLCREEKAKQKIEMEQLGAELERKRFFNQPSADADLEYWSKHSYWTLDEAIALTFGKNPHLVNWDTLKTPKENRLLRATAFSSSPFIEEYTKLRELVARAKTWEQLCDPISPGLFIAWAKRTNISYPAELEELIIRQGGTVSDWKIAYEQLKLLKENEGERFKESAAMLQKTLQIYEERVGLADEIISAKDATIGALEKRVSNLSTQIAASKEELTELQNIPAEKSVSARERDTLLKLVIGMAVDGYGYDPTAVKSPVPKELSDVLIRLGISVSDDTVREWLKKARELLPPQSE